MPCPIMTAASAATGDKKAAIFWCGCKWRKVFLWWVPEWHLWGCPFF